MNRGIIFQDPGYLTKRWILTAVCLLLLSLVIFPGSTLSVGNVHGVSPAVSPGLWAHYAISGNESGGTVDALFTVRQVSGSNVTFSDLDTFSDGHTTTDAVSVSISTGPTVPSSGQYFVISPQKQVGESVYPGDTKHYQNLTIQDIASHTIVFAKRQVAHVHAFNSSQIFTGSTPPSTTFEDFYWDDSTGMITEIVKSLNGAVVLHVTMSSTSLWQPDSSIDSFLIPSAVISLTSAVLIGFIIVGRYRRKAKRLAR